MSSGSRTQARAAPTHSIRRRRFSNFRLEKLETRELVGLCDFPSIWMQGQRKERGLHAHWDGNNSMMEERNKSAAFGTGTFPPTIDLKQVARVEQWLLTNEPPKYPFAIDAARSAQR